MQLLQKLLLLQGLELLLQPLKHLQGAGLLSSGGEQA